MSDTNDKISLSSADEDDTIPTFSCRPNGH